MDLIWSWFSDCVGFGSYLCILILYPSTDFFCLLGLVLVLVLVLVWFSSSPYLLVFNDGFLLSFWIYPFYYAYIYTRTIRSLVYMHQTTTISSRHQFNLCSFVFLFFSALASTSLYLYSGFVVTPLYSSRPRFSLSSLGHLYIVNDNGLAESVTK